MRSPRPTRRWLLVCLLLLSACQQTNIRHSNHFDQTETEVRLEFERLVAAAKNLDADSYFSLIDEQKFLGLSASGTIWTSTEDLSNLIRPGFDAIEKIESLAFTKLEISVIDPSTAVVVNEFTQTARLKNGARIQSQGGGAQVWSKSSGVWKLVSIAASDKPKP